MGEVPLWFTEVSLSRWQVANAGHMVPLDQPEAALAMLNTFMSNNAF